MELARVRSPEFIERSLDRSLDAKLLPEDSPPASWFF